VTSPEAFTESPVFASSLAAADQETPGGSSLLEELASKIPGFAGLYRNGPCSFVVIVTDGSQQTLAVRVVHELLEPLLSRECGGRLHVSVARARTTYMELLRYLDAAQGLLAIDGVVGVGLDLPNNGIVVVVKSRRVAAAVTAALPATGIPDGVVSIVVAGGGRSTPTRGRP
jgi:hypothetical protein